MCRDIHLLELEDVLVEVVLESLVGEVDAELLKAVVLIVLETKDVQHSDRQYLWENKCLRFDPSRANLQSIKQSATLCVP